MSWNTAAEQLFGHRAEQAIGRPLSLIIPPRLRAAHDAGLARAVQTGHARLAGHSVDILALHADGSEIPVDLSLSMWLEDGEPMFGALLRDIADRHTAKQRLEHLAQGYRYGRPMPASKIFDTYLHRSTAEQHMGSFAEPLRSTRRSHVSKRH